MITMTERVAMFTIEERLVIVAMTSNYNFSKTGYDFEMRLLEAMKLASRDSLAKLATGGFSQLHDALVSWRSGDLANRYHAALEAE